MVVDLLSNDISFTDSDFSIVSRIAEAQYGIQILANKKNLLHARIAKRMRHLNMKEFGSYLEMVDERRNSGEATYFKNILTTNTTYFFREEHHFQLLQETVFPQADLSGPGGSFNIWSAGCSSGQEPYSIAATVNSYKRQNPQVEFKIHATDLDEIVLQNAKCGLYQDIECRSLTDSQCEALFDNSEGDVRRIRQSNKSLVNFEVANLLGDLDNSISYDVIFCRNVVIYFARETQLKIWENFFRLLKPGGYLFLGHSERLAGPVLSEFESVGVTAYRRHKE